MWSSIWVEHDRDAREAWHNLFQDLQPFARHEGIEAAEVRYVVAWIRKARDQAISKRIGAAHESDGDRMGRLLQRPRWGCVGAHDHVRSETDQFGSIRSDRRGSTRAPTNVDADVTTLCPLQVLEALAER